MRIPGTICVFLALSCLSAAAQGAATTSREAFYRCKDASGQTHYGDSKPPECEGLDTEVLNERGMVIRIIEGTATAAVRSQREVSEKRVREERDQRLDQLESQFRVTELSIRNLRERQNSLQSQIARFKPYSDKPDALPLPDHLAEEMVLTVNGMNVYQEMLAKNRAEQAQITSSFESDIKRFKELKGIK